MERTIWYCRTICKSRFEGGSGQTYRFMSETSARAEAQKIESLHLSYVVRIEVGNYIQRIPIGMTPDAIRP
jgi:hypothetical protein